MNEEPQSPALPSAPQPGSASATLPEAAPAATINRKRLHPMTLLQRVILSLPGFVFLMLPVIRNPEGGNLFSLLVAVAYAVFAIPWIFVYYQRFRYSLSAREIIIESGVFTRQHRNIPLERIQNIAIEQSLLPRMLGTAKVMIETAGSGKAEGVLEYVSLAEAQAIRQIVRARQRGEVVEQPTPEVGSALTDTIDISNAPAAAETEEVGTLLYRMRPRRVVLAGMYKFSLVYIALAFSVLQYWEPDTEVLVDSLRRDTFAPVFTYITESPWLAATVAVILAALMSWLAGIITTFTRYYNFTLRDEETKLHKRHGLLTVLEGTIPRSKIQALILRSNPAMRRFGWFKMSVQTMGVEESRGPAVVIPFAQQTEIEELAPAIHPFTWPESIRHVSVQHIRRLGIRYSVTLLVGIAALYYWWSSALWGLIALPFIWCYAWLAWKHHRYAFDGTHLFVERGVIKQRFWVVPVHRFQVFFLDQSLFQRRLKLKSFYIDTAGAPDLGSAEIHDLPATLADELLAACHAAFDAVFKPQSEAEESSEIPQDELTVVSEVVLQGEDDLMSSELSQLQADSMLQNGMLAAAAKEVEEDLELATQASDADASSASSDDGAEASEEADGSGSLEAGETP